MRFSISRLLIIFFLLPLTTNIHSQNWQTILDDGIAHVVIQAENENVLVAGAFTLSNQNNGQNGLVKMDSTGEIIWTKDFDFPYSFYSVSLKLIEDGYLLYAFAYPLDEVGIFLTKIDFLGNEIWTSMIPNFQGFVVNNLIVDDVGNLFISASQPAENYRPVLIKIDAEGNLVWFKVNFGFDDKAVTSGRVFFTSEQTLLLVLVEEIETAIGEEEYYCTVVRLNEHGDVLNAMKIEDYTVRSSLYTSSCYINEEKIVLSGLRDDNNNKRVAMIDMFQNEIVWNVIWDDAEVYSNVSLFAGDISLINGNKIGLIGGDQSDVLLVLFDLSGNRISTNHFDFGEFERGYSLSESSQGNILIAGRKSPGGQEFDFLVFEVNINEVTPTSFVEHKKIALTLAPNPMGENLQINNAENYPLDAVLFDALGKKIASFAIKSNSLSNFDFPYPSGVYYFYAFNTKNNTQFTQKIVKYKK